MTMKPYIVAFTGGGQDGTYLAADGNSFTRVRGNAKPFPSKMDAVSYMSDYRLLGLNRPRRSVVYQPMREGEV
jgi:hypothetical protein